MNKKNVVNVGGGNRKKTESRFMSRIKLVHYISQFGLHYISLHGVEFKHKKGTFVR